LAGILKEKGQFPSLKALGIRYGYAVLQELPIAPGTVLTREQKHEIDAYNRHDLAITRLALASLDEAIEMRRVMSQEYGVNVTSMTDSTMGERLIIRAYESAMTAKLNPDPNEEPEPFRL